MELGQWVSFHDYTMSGDVGLVFHRYGGGEREGGGGGIEYERSVFLSPVGRVLAVFAAVVARERFDL